MRRQAMLQQLKNKLLVAAVNAKLRSLITPEQVHVWLSDALDMLNAQLGQVGLDAETLKQLESHIDIDELSASLAPRILHLLVADGT